MRIALVVIFTALGCRAAMPQHTTTAVAIVEVSVLAFDGGPAVDATVQMTERGTNTRLRQQFTITGDRMVIRDVPYGEYVLQVQRPGFRHGERVITVYQSRVSVRIFLRVAQSGDREPSEIVGSVIPIPPKGTKLWVNLLPLLTAESIAEAEVDTDGTFRIKGFDDGEYVLALMRGTEAIQLNQVRFYGTLRITLKLPPSASP